MNGIRDRDSKNKLSTRSKRQEFGKQAARAVGLSVVSSVQGTKRVVVVVRSGYCGEKIPMKRGKSNCTNDTVLFYVADYGVQ